MESEERFTDTMGMLSKFLSAVNIKGHRVEVREFKIGDKTIFNAYVNLKNSRYMKEGALVSTSFRKGDVIGVDTAHFRNTKMSDAECVLDALWQIEYAIEKYEECIDSKV